MDLPDLPCELGVLAASLARLLLGLTPSVAGGGRDGKFPEYGLAPQVRAGIDERGNTIPTPWTRLNHT
ncbi:hypothetical protein GCM10015535_32020 [Streptomyces gelaticus]|uniref:Uncharacterized protein n=1 Tax=Streptomyces gelaticus TaxID=285446 RepID=A0ABQ2VYP5_9ACTN|nr:hypothetical protein [Streptomyces gelaticus]GGV85435.1 hypothetical protein GCM10015535_32020 [Streptomyces gelaticus]